jgi:four helix bundle protein
MSFEQLRVYQAAQHLRAEVDRLKEKLKPGFENAFKHVDEAVDSITNNIAEGSASIYPARQRNFFDVAHGSAREARSGLRELDRRRAFNGGKVFRSIVLAQAIGKMLASLIRKLE